MSDRPTISELSFVKEPAKTDGEQPTTNHCDSKETEQKDKE